MTRILRQPWILFGFSRACSSSIIHFRTLDTFWHSCAPYGTRELPASSRPATFRILSALWGSYRMSWIKLAQMMCFLLRFTQFHGTLCASIREHLRLWYFRFLVMTFDVESRKNITKNFIVLITSGDDVLRLQLHFSAAYKTRYFFQIIFNDDVDSYPTTCGKKCMWRSGVTGRQSAL